MEMIAMAFRTLGWSRLGNDHLSAVLAIISRDPVSPPELTGNAPVTDVIGPIVIKLAHTGRDQADFAFIHCSICRLDQFVHLDEPLFLDHRLNDCRAPVMVSDGVLMIDDLDQKAFLFQIFHDPVTAFHRGKSLVFAAVLIDVAIICENTDLFQTVTLTQFKVVRVVCRSYLHGSGTDFQIDIRIGNDRHLSAD